LNDAGFAIECGDGYFRRPAFGTSGCTMPDTPTRHAPPERAAYVSPQLGHSSIQVTVDLYGHFAPGADRHHVEALAEAIEEAGREPAATPAQPLPAEVNDRDSK
jgi:hypothetical protein